MASLGRRDQRASLGRADAPEAAENPGRRDQEDHRGFPGVPENVESLGRRDQEENPDRLGVPENAESLGRRESQDRRDRREQPARRDQEETLDRAARQDLPAIRKTAYLHPFWDRKSSCRKTPVFRLRQTESIQPKIYLFTTITPYC